MPQFTYKAKQGPGKTVDGRIEADSLNAAIAKILQLGVTPLDVREGIVRETPVRRLKSLPKPSFEFFRKISHTEINNFTRQICDLVEAGVPLLRSLNIVYRQTKNPHLKSVLDNMQAVVRDGGTLSDAMAKHPKVFSSLYVNMIRSGELSGQLDMVLRRLAEFSEKDLDTRNKIKASLAYPTLIFLVGALTIFVLLSFVIPRLTVVFEDFGASLPWPTVILMNLSGFFARFGWLILIAAMAAGAYFVRMINSPKGRYWFDELKLKMPVIRTFIVDVEIGRLARTLATLLESGVVIIAALKSVAEVLTNEVLRQDIREAAERVANGESLTAGLKESPYFPEAALQMVAVGEETGHLEQSLHKLAGAYERRADQSMRTVVSLMGPVALVVIVSIVGFLVIAMLLPIFQMNLIVK